MTRKDYILIADSIKNSRENWEGYQEGQEAIDGLARCLATKLGQENPRFNRETFLTACGVK
jgi:hypothetical protein